MKHQTYARGFSRLLLGGTCLAAGLAISTAVAAPEAAAVKPAEGISIKGTCNFRGKDSTWSAKLTA
jgi:hypothetical protein